MNLPAHKPILLVEDDPNDILLLQRAFRKSLLTTPLQVVTNGELAVSYLLGAEPYNDRERHPLPSLILLDLKLPRKSGLEVLAWLRAQPGPMSRVPVVILSSSQQTVDINRAYDLGTNSYLVKPGEFEDFLLMVQGLSRYWFELNEQPDLRYQT